MLLLISHLHAFMRKPTVILVRDLAVALVVSATAFYYAAYITKQVNREDRHANAWDDGWEKAPALGVVLLASRIYHARTMSLPASLAELGDFQIPCKMRVAIRTGERPILLREVTPTEGILAGVELNSATQTDEALVLKSKLALASSVVDGRRYQIFWDGRMSTAD